MYADYNNRNSEEFPHGVYCPCGVIIHLKESEVCNATTIITCPKCGFQISYIRNCNLMSHERIYD